MVGVLLLLLLVVCSTFSQEVGEVVRHKGAVDIVKPDRLKGMPLSAAGKKLSVGDILRTKFGGYARVEFIDGSLVELYELSRLRVLDYETVREVKVERGVVRFEVISAKGVKGFRVHTRHAIIGVKGTTFWVYVLPGYTGVVVKEGKVKLTYRLKLPDSKWHTVKASKLLIIPEPFGDRPPSAGGEIGIRVVVQ
ncbi:FecR family protein [Hydrogenivirga sp.]